MRGEKKKPVSIVDPYETQNKSRFRTLKTELN